MGGRASRRRVKRIRDTEAEALEALRRLRSENHLLGAGGVPPRLDELMAQWLSDTKRRVRATTFRTYELVVRLHILKSGTIASMRIDTIRPAHISKHFADLEKKGVSERLRELAYLHLRAAIESQVGLTIAANPVQKSHRAKVERRSMSVWTQEQARTFLNATKDDWLAPLYRIALSVGLRRGELLALQWRDVDLKARRLSIQHTLTDDGKLVPPKTSGSRRAIELPSKAVHALSEQKAKLLAKGLRASPWVFPNTSGGSYSPRWLNRKFAAAIAAIRAKQAEHNPEQPPDFPEIRFHDLRHTCASLRLAAGDHPKVVQELLGHASVTITLNTYSHVASGLHRESADRFDAVL
jgi:integrase